MLWYQLARPFAYITIKHTAKSRVDWWVPGLLAGALLLIIFGNREFVNVWGAGGLITSIQSLVQSLPGFYIAALAAVATFAPQSTLDEFLPSPTPTVRSRFDGNWVLIRLTRRRFLCLLFAYLTAMSLTLTIFSAFAFAARPALLSHMSPGMFDVAKFVALGAYLLFFVQMLLATMWGLYYLSDRLHQDESPPTPPSDQSSTD